MKTSVKISCTGDMNAECNFTLIALGLERAYFRKVALRLHRKSFMLKNMPNKLMLEIAIKLEHIKLVNLFVGAQFAGLPPDICQHHFNRPYPPANVCFGGKCWDRYASYIERGIPDGN